ncbi:hypothetical protein QBC35DRAFT_515014 [Podospora australis]|uniref:Amine oxidase domain-containing protein n=1 Tax=Podospora australis TaxID=1536484 RepID=A0AAN7AI21_9PEZI|nr:hypothetical protein QBC35DRAFT_515014 [Podospora australis]
MDAYSMSISNPLHQTTSKIYRDLYQERCYSADRAPRNPSIMDRVIQLQFPRSNQSPHIGIVGAGLAGLRCADILLRYGFRVTILEARDRIGGRIYQEPLQDGHLVDLGANWIHGTKDNPILDLATETNTTVSHWDHESYVYDEDGTLLNLKDGERYSAIFWEIIEEAFKYSTEHEAEISPERTLLDFVKEKIPERIPGTEEAYEKKRIMLLQFADLWGAFVGSPIETQSLKFFWLEECIEGEALFCIGTYRKILDRIAKPAFEGAEIRLQTRVSEIHGKSTSPNEKPWIKTSDNQTIEFDQLIVTTPLGWLKQHAEAFFPRLPDRLSQAIQSIGYGCLEKIYLSFPAPFWLTPSPEGRRIQGYGQWLRPKYATSTNPSRWTHEVVELASLEGGHPTLLFYTYGSQSRYMTSTLRSLATTKEKLDFLFKFFKPYYSRLPSYNEEDPNCHPTFALATDWLGDDLAGNGSYANFQQGLEEGDKDVEIMRQGWPEEGIWLAGEHTAPFVALGTATGAYWSGERVAERVAGQYGKRVQNSAQGGQTGEVDLGN